MEISNDIFARQFLFARTIMLMMINMNNQLIDCHEIGEIEAGSVPDDKVAQGYLIFH